MAIEGSVKNNKTLDEGIVKKTSDRIKQKTEGRINIRIQQYMKDKFTEIIKRKYDVSVTQYFKDIIKKEIEEEKKAIFDKLNANQKK